jgi:hypothetical protein
VTESAIVSAAANGNARAKSSGVRPARSAAVRTGVGMTAAANRAGFARTVYAAEICREAIVTGKGRPVRPFAVSDRPVAVAAGRRGL